MKENRNCKECRNYFECYKSNSQKFCSYKCYWTQMRSRKGEVTSHWQGGKPKCLKCNKQLESRYARYCLLHAAAGERSYKWKGEEVGYTALHTWVRKTLGQATFCSYDLTHKSTRFHWANISGAYLREIDDWAQLCPRCHKTYDSVVNKPAKRIFYTLNNRYSERRVI